MEERQEERLHPPLEGRPWWGECFLWFVSFAPKEMNITFGSFPKQASLNLGEDLNTGFLRFDYSNGAI